MILAPYRDWPPRTRDGGWWEFEAEKKRVPSFERLCLAGAPPPYCCPYPSPYRTHPLCCAPHRAPLPHRPPGRWYYVYQWFKRRAPHRAPLPHRPPGPAPRLHTRAVAAAAAAAAAAAEARGTGRPG